MKTAASALALALVTLSAPASAKVAEVSERGFVVRYVAEVPADAGKAWDMLFKPSEWWDPQHTWSGSARNMSIEPRPGGCFCEVLADKDSPRAAPHGGVEHMRVLYIERPRALRMAGVLGPLQAEAANGTMTFELKPAPDGKGTQILLEYIVGGYVRTPYEKVAPAVDGVLGEQLRRLAEKLGATFDAAPKGAARKERRPGESRPKTIGR